MRAAYDFDDLASFLRSLLRRDVASCCTEADFYDLAMAYFAQVARDGLVYVEMFFDPQAHTSRGISFKTVITGLRRAQQDASDRLGIGSQLIMCFLRDHSVGVGVRDARAGAADIATGSLGVGLDSDERGNPPEKFQEVFAAARAQGYRLTMHCDVDQEDSIAHIRQCLDRSASSALITA